MKKIKEPKQYFAEINFYENISKCLLYKLNCFEVNI